ncbi:MAG: DUF3568 family protein [Phycisphaerales bacterium]
MTTRPTARRRAAALLTTLTTAGSPPLAALAALAAVALAALLPAACSLHNNPAGTDRYAYAGGGLTSEVPDSLDRTLQAAIAAAEESELIIRRREQGDGWARLLAEQGDGKDVRIRLHRLAPNLTQVKIRVGLIGDEPQSRVILDRIRFTLAVAP